MSDFPEEHPEEAMPVEGDEISDEADPGYSESQYQALHESATDGEFRPRRVALTESQERVTLIAERSASILRGRAGVFASTSSVKAEEVKALTTFILSAAQVLDEQGTVDDGPEVEIVGDVPPFLQPFLGQIKDQIRQAAREGRSETGGIIVTPADSPNREGRDELDDDGQVWHHLPVTALEDGSITKEYRVVSATEIKETDSGVVVEFDLLRHDSDERQHVTLSADEHVWTLCDACTTMEAQRRMG